MDFIGWVTGLAGGVGNDIRKAVNFVLDGLKTLWHLLGVLAHNVGRAWHELYTAVTHAGLYLATLARNTWTQLRRILLVTIPTAIKNVLTTAARYATTLAGEVKAYTLGAIRAVTAWAARLVADLEAWARSAVRWITNQLSALASTVATVARLVAARLTHPEALAQWVIGALWHLVMRLIVAQAENIVRALLHVGVRLFLRSLSTIERIIADAI